MKKIINGKMYNTETAKAIATYSNGGSGFSYWEETLYLKKTGEFFLLGEGGAQTKYAEYSANGWCSGGAQIIPLTREKAQKWLEKYADAESYISVFGEPEE